MLRRRPPNRPPWLSNCPSHPPALPSSYFEHQQHWGHSIGHYSPVLALSELSIHYSAHHFTCLKTLLPSFLILRIFELKYIFWKR